MSTTVCLAANTLDYPQGGGHLWVHLNWALGLKSLDCNVIWLELVQPDVSIESLRNWVNVLRRHLTVYELQDSLALWPAGNQSLPKDLGVHSLNMDEAAQTDLLIDFRYDLPQHLVSYFRHSAMLDIDPGELQIWINKGEITLAAHNIYFTIGETVGQRGARFPDGGIRWHYTPPSVSLDWWPPRWAGPGAAFSTVAHWYDGWMEDDGGGYGDGKRSGFLPYLELPRRTGQHFELALDLWPGDDDQKLLWQNGWRVQDSATVVSTPRDYQRYIQNSRGEFSCAKPHCVRLQNAWISDRTLCYLASGKPAIVQHTGPSRFLPDAAGLFRFRDPDEAAQQVHSVIDDYENHCHLARSLAEEHFDAKKVVKKVLERALS